MKLRSAPGFTLVEMMITLVIFLALVAFSLPSLRTLWQNNQLRSSADSVLSGIQLARSEAMKRNARVYFFITSSLTSACTLDPAGRFWVVSLADPTSKCDITPSSTTAPKTIQTGRLADVTGNVTIAGVDSAAGDAYAVGFGGSGFVAANADASNSIAEISFDAPKLGSNAYQLKIQIADAGRVKMCSVSATSGDSRACD